MTGSIDMECFVTISICGQCSRLEAALHPGLHTRQAGCGPLPSPFPPPGSQGAEPSGLLCAPTFPLTGMDKPSLCWSRKKEVQSQPQGDPWRGPHPLRGPGHLTEMWGIVEAGGASVPALWLLTH